MNSEIMFYMVAIATLGVCLIYMLDQMDQERGSVFGSVFFYLLSLRLWRDLYGGEVIIFLSGRICRSVSEIRFVSSEALVVYSDM